MTLTITHSHAEGTLIQGTARGDGTNLILKASGWRWGRSIGLWFLPMSRDHMAKTWLIDGTAGALREAGFEVVVEIDDTPRPTEVVEAAKIDRQEGRVEALEAKAERRGAEADAAYERAIARLKELPEGGEPIKVGHHSERGHRRAINRADYAMGQSVQAAAAALEAERRATEAAHTTGARYSAITVANRIKKLEADARRTQRWLDGERKWLTRPDGTTYLTDEPVPAAGAYREKLEVMLTQQQDQVAYWVGVREAQVEEGKATNFTREMIKPGDWVNHRFGWVQVVRANPKTVSVKTEYTWTDKIEYEALTGHMTAAEYDAAVARVNA